MQYPSNAESNFSDNNNPLVSKKKASNRSLFLNTSSIDIDKPIHPSLAPKHHVKKEDLGASATWDLSPLYQGSIGIDMVSVSIDLNEDNFSGDFLTSLFNGGRYKGKIQLPGGFPDVFASFNNYAFQLNLRFNPSNFTRDRGFEVCPIELLPHLVDLVLCTVFDYASKGSLPPYKANNGLLARVNRRTGEISNPPKNWLETIHISSLDFTRDLTVVGCDFLLAQMKNFHPKGYKIIVHYLNDGQINTITHQSGKKSPRFKIYNKTVERDSKIASGKKHLARFEEEILRFEVHLPRAYLTEQLQIFTLADLTPTNFYLMGEKLWEKSGMNQPIHWDGQKMQDMFDAGMNSSEVLEFIGLFMAKRNDVSFHTNTWFSDEFKEKFWALGFDFDESIFEQGKNYAQWNFQTGLLEYLK